MAKKRLKSIGNRRRSFTATARKRKRMPRVKVAPISTLKGRMATFLEKDKLPPLHESWRHQPTLPEVPWDRPRIAPKPLTVPELLRNAAATYEERNKTYGDNYKSYGKLLDSLFPKGLVIPAGDIAALNRLGLIHMVAAKLQRYCHNPNGYHKDSAHDGSVYFAMLEEMTPS